jgi:hypothetical protein
MCALEQVSGRTRRPLHRPTKDRSRAELNDQSAGSRRRLQRAHMDAEFSGQLVEGQQFGSSRVIGDRGPGALEDRRWERSPSAIPGTKRLQRHAQERSKLLLQKAHAVAQLAQTVHLKNDRSRWDER